jgi:hypothetical protein
VSHFGRHLAHGLSQLRIIEHLPHLAAQSLPPIRVRDHPQPDGNRDHTAHDHENATRRPTRQIFKSPAAGHEFAGFLFIACNSA